MANDHLRFSDITGDQSELLYFLVEKIRSGKFLAGETKDGPFIIPSDTGSSLPNSELPPFSDTDLYALADQKYLTVVPTRHGDLECSLTEKAMASKDAASHAGKVFIVHGHDEGLKDTVARFLEHRGLQAIVLHEQPNRGLTIIEKFETYSKGVQFAVVLMTGDDRGGVASDPPDKFSPRARQNVVLELGFFMAKLGRGHVCALYEPGVEIPSDYTGVLYIPLDKAGAWKSKLADELALAKDP